MKQTIIQFMYLIWGIGSLVIITYSLYLKGVFELIKSKLVQRGLNE